MSDGKEQEQEQEQYGKGQRAPRTTTRPTQLEVASGLLLQQTPSSLDEARTMEWAAIAAPPTSARPPRGDLLIFYSHPLKLRQVVERSRW